MDNRNVQVGANGRRLFSVEKAAILLGLSAVMLGGCAGTDRTGDEVQNEYTFWPSYPNEPRIQYLVSYESSLDIKPPASKLEELAFGKEPEAFFTIGKPYGVEMYGDEIFLCDTKTAAVVILDPANHEFRLMGAKNPGKLVRPIDIAISEDGTRYVADNMQEKVVVYDSKDRYLDVFDTGESSKPVAVSVFGDRLYVAEFARHQISIRNRYTGQEIATIGGSGRGDGQFSGPIGVAHDKDGNIYVTDLFGYRVQRFGSDGSFQERIGQQGDQPGTFARPKHIAVDGADVVYVVDAAFQNVQMFSTKGDLLMYFGGAGEFPGSMDLPAGVCVKEGDVGYFERFVHPAFNAERLVVVSNQFGNNKVSVYAMGRLKAGHDLEEINATQRKIPGLNDQLELPSMFRGTPPGGGDDGAGGDQGQPTSSPATDDGSGKSGG